jgi:hypothetical protein
VARRPRRVGVRTRDDVFDRDELELPFGPRDVHEALWLLGVDHEIVDRSLVEVVVAHDPALGCAMQPVMIRLPAPFT